MLLSGKFGRIILFGKKTKTIYEGRKMNVGSNRVPRPDNILACGKPCMPTVTLFPYWGTPSPLLSTAKPDGPASTGAARLDSPNPVAV